MEFNNLPLYQVTIDENDQSEGAFIISLVGKPANEKEFIKLSRQQTKIDLSFNEEKKIITGIALRADYPIYRKENGQEYYIQFSADTIERIVYKFMKEGRIKDVSLEHTGKDTLEGVYMFESFLLNENDKLTYPQFKDVAAGSWMVSYKVENDELWNDIKKGKYNGFSPEIVSTLSNTNTDYLKRLQEITELVSLIEN